MKKIVMMVMVCTVLSVALSGCGGGGGSTAASVPDGTPLGSLNASTAKSTPLAIGDADCPTGGILVQTGIDKNGSGILDDSEVSSSQKVCNGATGATGATGPAGSAAATTMNGRIYCSGSLANTNPTLYFSYDVAQFSSNFLLASADVRNQAIQASGTEFYASTQNGYSNAGVIIIFDQWGAATSGWWNITLNRSTLVTTIEYNDIGDVAGGKLTWTMTPDKCIQTLF